MTLEDRLIEIGHNSDDCGQSLLDAANYLWPEFEFTATYDFCLRVYVTYRIR